jgi:hypothetical protein
MSRGLILTSFFFVLAADGQARANRASEFDSARVRAHEALAGVTPDARQLVVRWAPGRPTPAVVRGMHVAVQGDSPTQRASAFLHRHGDLVIDGNQLLPVNVRQTKKRTVVRFQQTHRGLPVLGATVTVSMDSANRVRSLHSAVRLTTVKDIVPKVDGARAIRAASSAVAGKPATEGQTTLAISPRGGGILVHAVTLSMTLDPLGRRHLVDAHTGRYIGWLPGVVVDGEVWR